jgi:hypothetical protein
LAAGFAEFSEFSGFVWDHKGWADCLFHVKRVLKKEAADGCSFFFCFFIFSKGGKNEDYPKPVYRHLDEDRPTE